MGKMYRISQGEHWARTYFIEAKDEEDARSIYAQYLIDGDETHIDMIGEPDYIGDITDDIDVMEDFR